LKEGVIAACLTALMILLFLGSWRSTLVVATSIPLSILCSIIILSALGQTMNLMTLGGLALAVGILVDDATVEIENIHRNLAMKKPMVRAILDGASQIVTVTNDNRIHWQKISVGRDFGTQLEVLDGLAENTKVVINPTDDLVEDVQVQVKLAEKPKTDIAATSASHQFLMWRRNNICILSS
jgi:hypothetical protein